MKRISIPVYLLLAIAAGFWCFAAFAQQKVVKQVPAKPTAAVSGKELFHQYCAVCHGQDAKGNGPAAGALKKSPTDLTQISRGNHGKFPEERIMATLRGTDAITAHGGQNMPVWGPIFNNMSPNLSETQERLHGLLNYLEEIQAK
ncbi:MAG TPA: c-type cytochrome [Bryobacteraceae bacterium]|nr:c-type cytochrome [Bryobacteraceae bacterium]